MARFLDVAGGMTPHANCVTLFLGATSLKSCDRPILTSEIVFPRLAVRKWGQLLKFQHWTSLQYPETLKG